MQVSVTAPPPMMVALLSSLGEAEAGSQKDSGKPETTQPGTNRTRMHRAACVTSMRNFMPSSSNQHSESWAMRSQGLWE